MKINLVSQILLFSLMIVILRLLLGAIQLNFQYSIDFALLISYGVTVFFNYKKSKRKKCSDFYFSVGIIQIISSLILFEIAKLIIYSPELSLEYFYARIIVFIYILILGLLANGFSLLLFCTHLRKNVNDETDVNIIDRE